MMTTDRHARFRLLRRFTVGFTVASVALAGAFYLQVAGVLGAAAAVINSPDVSGPAPAPTDGGGGNPQPPQQPQPAPGGGSPVVVTGGS